MCVISFQSKVRGLRHAPIGLKQPKVPLVKDQYNFYMEAAQGCQVGNKLRGNFTAGLLGGAVSPLAGPGQRPGGGAGGKLPEVLRF